MPFYFEEKIHHTLKVSAGGAAPFITILMNFTEFSDADEGVAAQLNRGKILAQI